ncbi:replication factor C large subunit [Candidatus Micrarchaeota archaeon]|nr:replication factor C large subunit [Candidatus Micrarchaeota archaeon]
MLLTVKYAPKSIDEMIGNDEGRERINKWMLNWLAGNKRKPLLVYGPPGVGKTSVTYALKNQYDIELVEMNASELRNRNRVEHIVKSATLAGTLSGKDKLILIDDVDIFAGRKDSGGPGAVASILKETACPVILTATDAWDKKISAIRSECELVEMKKINKIAIGKLLESIAKKENMDIGAGRIAEIAENAAGDVRSALNDLQANGTGLRDREKDIFVKMKTLFKAVTYGEARSVAYGDVDFNILKLWIDENIPNEYESAADIATAYRWLSKSDVFEGRIRKSSWVLLKYAIDLATAGVALSKSRPYAKFTKYAFPEYLREMSRSMQTRALMKSVGLKIGGKTHTNRRHALEMLPLIAMQMQKNGEGIERYYEFDESEMEFIAGSRPKRSVKS